MCYVATDVSRARACGIKFLRGDGRGLGAMMLWAMGNHLCGCVCVYVCVCVSRTVAGGTKCLLGCCCCSPRSRMYAGHCRPNNRTKNPDALFAKCAIPQSIPKRVGTRSRFRGVALVLLFTNSCYPKQSRYVSVTSLGWRHAPTDLHLRTHVRTGTHSHGVVASRRAVRLSTTRRGLHRRKQTPRHNNHCGNASNRPLAHLSRTMPGIRFRQPVGCPCGVAEVERLLG